jgi:hypothetical protein
MPALISSDFDLVQDLARILHIVPHYWSRESDTSIRFLAHGGSEADASEFESFIHEDYVLMVETLDDEGTKVGAVMHEIVGGDKRYVQLLLRSSLLPGPMLIEGKVWPVGTTQAQVEEAVLALQEDSETEDDDDGREVEHESQPAAPVRRPIGSTAVRPVNVARDDGRKHFRAHGKQESGILAWLRRNF